MHIAGNRPLALNYSYPAVNKRHKRAKTHYLGNYVPTTISSDNNTQLVNESLVSKISFIPSVHTTGFSPTVYRQQTEEECVRTGTRSYEGFDNPVQSLFSYLAYRRTLSSIGGFKNKATVIGLLNIGYIDIDDVKDTSNGNFPTVENVEAAMLAEGIWCYVHPSASRLPNKLRVLYRRDLTVYSDNHYDVSKNEWKLSGVELGNIKAIRDDGTEVIVNQNLVALIITILSAEYKEFSRILDKYGINSSGVDTSAQDPSMHSKHITMNNGKILPSKIHNGKELLCLG